MISCRPFFQFRNFLKCWHGRPETSTLKHAGTPQLCLNMPKSETVVTSGLFELAVLSRIFQQIIRNLSGLWYLVNRSSTWGYHLIFLFTILCTLLVGSYSLKPITYDFVCLSPLLYLYHNPTFMPSLSLRQQTIKMALFLFVGLPDESETTDKQSICVSSFWRAFFLRHFGLDSSFFSGPLTSYDSFKRIPLRQIRLNKKSHKDRRKNSFSIASNKSEFAKGFDTYATQLSENIEYWFDELVHLHQQPMSTYIRRTYVLYFTVIDYFRSPQFNSWICYLLATDSMHLEIF